MLFLPVELIMFYAMGIFRGRGSILFWLIFGGIIAIMYVVSLLIDLVIMNRRAADYTAKLEEYKRSGNTERD